VPIQSVTPGPLAAFFILNGDNKDTDIMSPTSTVIDLPISPLRSTVSEGDLHDAPVVAMLMDGKTISGRLAGLDGPRATVTLVGKENNRIPIDFSRLRRLNFINKHPVNRDKHPLEGRGGEVLMPREAQEFRIVFSDNRMLTGRTRGSFVDEIGIHLFQVIGADHISRLFIPAKVIRKYSIGHKRIEEIRPAPVKTEKPAPAASGQNPAPKRRKSDSKGRKATVQDSWQLRQKLEMPDSPPGDLLASKRIGEMLVEDGIITPEQLEAALAGQKRDCGKRIGEILVGMGTVKAGEIFSALAHKFGMPFVLLRDFFIDIACLNLVPVDIARKHMLIPLLLYNDRLVIAMDDPANTEAITLLRFMTQYKIEPTIATREDIAWAIDKYYGHPASAVAIDEAHLATSIRQRLKPAEQRHENDQPSMAKAISSFVGNTIIDAIERHASDIHLIPAGSHANLLFRIDGKLIPVRRISSMLLPAIINRLAVMGDIDAAPAGGLRQGRACMVCKDHAIELRISLGPERIPDGAIIHVLNAITRLAPVTGIGLDPREQQLLLEMLSKSYSLVIVTGPEDSGKTRTLYAVLRELQSMHLDIVTVETPVKYYMNGIHQIQGKEDLATALGQVRGLNPRIVMIDDLHNPRTLQTAVECALNGSLVLGKLHAANAARAIETLIDAGIAPRLLNSTLVGVLAQHLVRLNCQFCAEEERIPPAVRKLHGVGDDEVFFRGTGCSHCNHTGYTGEQAVFELTGISTGIQALISDKAAAAEIERQAIAEGMSSIAEGALHLARTRKTSLAEVHRLCERLRQAPD
jgi:type IV pilus assembly protein PilB